MQKEHPIILEPESIPITTTPLNEDQQAKVFRWVEYAKEKIHYLADQGARDWSTIGQQLEKIEMLSKTVEEQKLSIQGLERWLRRRSKGSLETYEIGSEVLIPEAGVKAKIVGIRIEKDGLYYVTSRFKDGSRVIDTFAATEVLLDDGDVLPLTSDQPII